MYAHAFAKWISFLNSIFMPFGQVVAGLRPRLLWVKFWLHHLILTLGKNFNLLSLSFFIWNEHNKFPCQKVIMIVKLWWCKAYHQFQTQQMLNGNKNQTWQYLHIQFLFLDKVIYFCAYFVCFHKNFFHLVICLHHEAIVCRNYFIHY